MPTGPILSPDDPRYGRPAGPPPVIYSDRAAGTQQTYPDRDNGVPAAGLIYGNEDRGLASAGGDRSSAGGHWSAPGVTGTVPQQAAGRRRRQADGARPRCRRRNSRKRRPRSCRRTCAARKWRSPPRSRRERIVVDTPNTYLYYVLGGGRAIRYGVRVGRDGFTWTGVQKISRKAEWPDWHPPTEMIERQPYLPRFMAGGPGNPLGARAMYLGSTVYRIHGTNQPSTIGKFVSSGCIGMLNEDVSDLFDRVKVGTRVVVLPGGPPPGTATASAAPDARWRPLVRLRRPSRAVPGTQPTVVPPLPAPVTVR